MRLRRAWRRAAVRRDAERQGATPEHAKLIADLLYPLPGQAPIQWVQLNDDGTVITDRDEGIGQYL